MKQEGDRLTICNCIKGNIKDRLNSNSCLKTLQLLGRNISRFRFFFLIYYSLQYLPRCLQFRNPNQLSSYYFIFHEQVVTEWIRRETLDSR